MKYYDSINNLPMYNFDVINNTGDFSYLLIEKVNINLENVWAKIYNEYIEEFGIPENYKTYIFLQIEALNIYQKAYSENKKHLLTLAEVKDKESITYLSENVKLSETSAILSKYMGYRINPAEISVKEFMSYIKLAENG